MYITENTNPHTRITCPSYSSYHTLTHMFVTDIKGRSLDTCEFFSKHIQATFVDAFKVPLGYKFTIHTIACSTFCDDWALLHYF